MTHGTGVSLAALRESFAGVIIKVKLPFHWDYSVNRMEMWIAGNHLTPWRNEFNIAENTIKIGGHF